MTQQGFIKFTKKSLAFILIAVTILTSIVILHPKSASAAWFDENFAYRQAITVTVTSSTSDITNLETLLTVNTSSLISSKLQSNCQDLRFTSVSGKQLPYYIDSGCNTTTTKIWVMADLVPKNTTTYTMYMYYGNPSAPAASSSTKFDNVVGLVGYWTMNDTSGSTATDSSIKGNNLTATGTTIASAQYANGRTFNGTSDTASNGSATGLPSGNTDRTIEAWVNASTISSFNRLIAQQGAGSTNNAFLLGVATGPKFFVSTWGASNDLNDTSTFSTSTWYHVVGTYTGGIESLYVNGVLKATKNITSTNTTSATSMFVGSDINSGEFFPGQIDDVKIYNIARTQAQITADYANTSCGGQTCTIATTAVGTIVPSTAFASEEKAPSPVAYWKFDEGTGTSAKDSTSNANTGTLSGSTLPTWQTEDQCVSGKCLYFNGTSSYVNLTKTSALSPGTGDYTIAAWVKSNSSTGTSQGIFWNRVDATNFPLVDLEILNSGKANVIFRDSANSATATGGPSINADNKWHYVVGVRSGTNVSVYVDGVLGGSGSNASLGNINVTSGFKAMIGSEATASDVTTGFFPGFIDEPKIYDYARSSAQILADYNSRSSLIGTSSTIGSQNQPAALSNGLVGYWKMDESSWNGTSGEVKDASGNGNNGTAAGSTGTATITTGKFGNGGSFTRANHHYINAGNASSLQITGAITLSAWIKLNSNNVNEDVITKDGISGNYSYQLVTNTNGTMNFNFSGDGSTTPGSVNGSTVLSTGTWYFVTGVYIPGKSVAIYVNGIQDGINTTNIPSSQFASTANLIIGSENTGGNNSMDGTIDEARVYNRALSSADISTLYNFAPGPVGYWDFENGSGTAVSDKSGNANTGTWNGSGTTHWRPGKYGTGGNFDGSTDYVAVTDNATESITGTGLSIGSWIKLNSNSVQSSIVEKYDSGSGGKNGYLFRVLSTGVLEAGVADASGFTTVDDTNTLSANTWYFVEMTYDGSNIRIYVNGVLNKTGAATKSITDGTTEFRIGGEGATNPAQGNSMHGLTDEVKIYNYARTQGQVIQDMNAGHPAPGSPVGTPLGFWKFDEGFGTTANNSGNQGSTLNGTLTNMSSPATSTSGWTQSGKFNKALNFDGSNDYVTEPDSDSLSFGNGTSDRAFTISAWIKMTSATQFRIFTKGGFTSTREYGFATDSSNNLFVQLFTNNNAATIQATTNSALTSDAGNWIHVTATYDGSSTAGGLKLYKNGILLATTNSMTGSYTAMTNQTTGAFIGNWFGDSATTSMANGSIDEVKVYGQALTADQVKLDYNRGSTQVLGALSDNSTYQPSAANQEYCVPGDSTSCTAPVGRWDFDQGTGTSVQDTSGNANTGTWNGTGTRHWLPGKVGEGGNFNGSDDYVETASWAAPTANLTWEAWFKPTNTFNGSMSPSYQIIANTFIDANNRDQLFYDKSAGALRYSIGVSGSFTNVLSYTSTYTAGTWYHAVVTRNSNSWVMYVNGASVATATDATSSTAGNRKVEIGRDGGGDFFNGQIDNVRIFNYARTTAQVAWDYNRGGPVGYWRLDDCQGDKVIDSSGNGNTGTITVGGSGTYTSLGTCTSSSASSMWFNGATGKRNYSLAFDGTDDYINVADSNSLDVTNAITISSWIKQNTGGSLQAIIHKGTGTTTADIVDNYRVFISSSNKINFLYAKAGLTNIRQFTLNNYTLTQGSWHNIVVTYTYPTLTSIKIYVDGVPYSNTDGTWADGNGTSTSSDMTVDANTNPVLIGTRYFNGNIQFFNGQIDDVKIFNYPLTAGQVKTLYNGGAVNYGPATGAP